MSRRLKITLPDTLALQLDELAASTGDPVARLAGEMVRHGIAEAAANGPADRRAPGRPSSRPEHPRRKIPTGGHRGLSPTAEMRNGAPGCGAGSSLYTAATRQRSPS